MWEPGVLQDTLALEDFLRAVVCGGSSGRPGRGRCPEVGMKGPKGERKGGRGAGH